MNKLVIRAGQEAYDQISKSGFSPEIVKAVVSAAGGPKWFTTYGLTRYIIGDLLQDVSHPVDYLGSSVGSWQMAAALTSNPNAAIDRLQQAYATSTYSDKPDSREISEVCADIIKSVLSDEEDHILNNNIRKLHIITSRGRGWLSSKSKVALGTGLAFGYSANGLNRKWLNKAVERVVFSLSPQLPYISDADYLPTTQIKLTKDNLLPALRASGAIPFMMEGITSIPDAPHGTYWDGGLTDYHITLPYSTDGIVLHPHFLPDVTKGWFDKKLPRNRKATAEYMSKVLLVTPSEEFVNTLPRKQISDMKDFKFFGLDQDARIQYWNEISERSKELGEELREVIESDSLPQETTLYTA